MIFKRLAICVLVCLAAFVPAHARNVFVLPAGTTANLPIGVFAADPFSNSNNVPGPAGPIAVLAVPNGTKYYVIAGGAADTLTVLDASFNMVGSSRSIAQARAAAVSPDGRYLLIAADTLRIFDTNTDQEVRSLPVGSNPNDIAFSIDGTRAFVVSSTDQRITAIDMATLSVITPAITITGGSTPTTLATGPNGFIYAAGVNRVREIDPQTLAIRGEIEITGNPGELVFSTNGQYAIAPNLEPINGGSSAILVDLVNRRFAGRVPSVGNTPFQLIVPGGRNAAGQDRVYAFSSTGGTVIEVIIPTLQSSTPAFVNTLGQVAGIGASNEFPARYLFASSGTNLYRIDLTTNEITGGPLSLQTPSGLIFYAGPITTTGASSIVAFNNNQNVVASTGVLTPIVVRVTDAAGRPIGDTPISFTSATGNVTFTRASTRTTSEGYAVVLPATPATTGVYTFTASAGGASSDITFNATGGTSGGGTGPGTGVPGASVRVVSGNGQALQAPIFFLSEAIRYEVRDASGNPVPNADVNITVTSGANSGRIAPAEGTVSLSCSTESFCTAKTDANGQVAIGFTASALIGSQPVQTVVINLTYGGASADAYITILQQNVLLQRDMIRPEPNTTLEVRAGQTLTDAVRFRFYSFGGIIGVPTLLPGVGLSVETQFNDPRQGTGPTASCAGGVVVSGANGEASCDLVAGPVPGETNLLITAGGNRFGNVRLRVLPGGATRINIVSGNNQSLAPGQTLQLPLTAQLLDNAGQPVANQQVNWELTSAGGAGLASPTVSTSNAQGQVSTRLTAGNTPGTYQVRVGVPGTNVVATFSFTVTSPVGGITAVSGGGQAAQRGAAFSQPLVVRITPGPGASAQGVPVSFVVTSGSATLSAPTATTNTSGEASVNVTAGQTQGPVVITASVGGVSTTFNLTVSPPGPQFTASNLVNAASFGPVQQVAPGMLLTITGTGLAPGVQGVVSGPIVGPYATTLGGVEVLIGGLVAPILHVANSGGREQVTVQVPFEIPTSGTTSVTVRVQGGSTTLQNVPLGPLQPGIFTTNIGDQNVAVLVRQDGSFVTPSSPARRGETLRMFVHGLGQVSPGTATNQAGTGDQRVNAPLIIGVNNAGVPGQVTAEYVEGFVGLYLVTFQVPPDAPTGRATLVIGAQGPDGQTYFSNTVNFHVQ